MSAVIWLLWLQFCFFAAVLSVFWTMLTKTHAKAAQTSQRADLLPPVAKTANQANTTATAAKSVTDVISFNASFLASLNSGSTPGGFGGPASNSPANLFNWANDATARFNQIYTIMQGTNLWS